MKDVMTGTSKDKCKSQTNITGNLWKLTDLWRQSVSGNMIVRKRKGWKKDTGSANGNTTGRKPSWMNYMHRRNRQGGKPYNT